MPKPKNFGNVKSTKIAQNVVIVEQLPDLDTQGRVSQVIKNLEFQEINKIKEISQHPEIVEQLPDLNSRQKDN